MSAPDRNQLREALKQAADAAKPTAIDVDDVLRRSRAQRRARRTAVLSATGAVAAVLIVGGLVLGLQRTGGPTTADAPAMQSAEVAPDDAASGAADATDGARLMAPEDLNRCGAPVAEPSDAAATPLTVTVAAPADIVAPGTTNRVEVTITNTEDAPVVGSIGEPPSLTVADDGVTVWHSGAEVGASARAITLAPGESVVLEGTFVARACASGDDAEGDLLDDLPPLDPGDYTVGAVVSFTDQSGMTSLLVSSFTPIRVG